MTSHLFQVDVLKVYSENCVVFLLSEWVRRHSSCTPEQLEELAHNVGVVNLSISYLHTIMPHLEWFRGCSGMEALPILMLHKASGTTELSSKWSGPAVWRLKPRSGVLPQGSQPTKLSIAIGAEDVKELVAGEAIYGDAVYRNGFYFNCFSYMKTADEKKPLGMFLHASSSDMETALGITWTDGRGVAVRYSLIIPGLPRGQRCAATLVGSNGTGYFVCFKRPTIEEVFAPFLANGGSLELSAEVIDVQ